MVNFRLTFPGAQEKKDYEILTAEISKATFGVTPSEYKDLKRLQRENLRDHMDDFELIFTMLGERSTTEIHRNEDSQSTAKLKNAGLIRNQKYRLKSRNQSRCRIGPNWTKSFLTRST